VCKLAAKRGDLEMLQYPKANGGEKKKQTKKQKREGEQKTKNENGCAACVNLLRREVTYGCYSIQSKKERTGKKANKKTKKEKQKNQKRNFNLAIQLVEIFVYSIDFLEKTKTKQNKKENKKQKREKVTCSRFFTF
jgi:hypothetical protein